MTKEEYLHMRKLEYAAFEAMKEHFRSTTGHGVGTEFWITGRDTVDLNVLCHCGWEWPV